MAATNWFVLGGVFLALGLAVLTVSQLMLWQWLKHFKQE